MGIDWEDPNATQELFKDKETWGRVLPVRGTLFSWFCILGNLQLSLRHPDNIGPSSAYVKAMAKTIAEALIDEIPALDQAFVDKAGWDEFGVEIEKGDNDE